MDNRKYKIPYNFDKDSIPRILELGIFSKDNVDCVYIPCFRLHGYSTRQKYTNFETTWEEYVSHLLYIQEMGLPIEILFQCSNAIPTIVLKKYIDLGIRKFTVYSDENARRLKSIDASIYITKSITACLTTEEIINLNKDLYDEVCLFWYFNRNINLISLLPKHFKYSIIPTCGCALDCTICHEHWAHQSPYCLYGVRRKYRADTYIAYKDLEYFDEYISSYKLLDRQDNTDTMIEQFNVYFSDEFDNDFSKDISYYLSTPSKMMKPINEEKYHGGEIMSIPEPKGQTLDELFNTDLSPEKVKTYSMDELVDYLVKYGIIESPETAQLILVEKIQEMRKEDDEFPIRYYTPDRPMSEEGRNVGHVECLTDEYIENNMSE